MTGSRMHRSAVAKKNSTRLGGAPKYPIQPFDFFFFGVESNHGTCSPVIHMALSTRKREPRQAGNGATVARKGVTGPFPISAPPPFRASGPPHFPVRGSIGGSAASRSAPPAGFPPGDREFVSKARRARAAQMTARRASGSRFFSRTLSRSASHDEQHHRAHSTRDVSRCAGHERREGNSRPWPRTSS